MSRNRRKLYWLVALLIISGGVTLFLRLPVALTATTAPDDQTVPAQTSEPSAYEPEVQQLLETTYLGHAAALPDPNEPAVVLQKYLEQNAHGYQSLLAEQSDKLDAALGEWETLVQQYPKSRHAFVGLAKHYLTKALVTGDIQYTRQAADAYVRAVDLALAHGHIRYTREVSTLLGELGDKKGLDGVFSRILARPKDLDRTGFYLALVDYAEELARFDDNRAWAYFEQAVDFHPENNLEAINRYAQRLLDRGQAQKAFEVLNTRLTTEQRVKYVLPAQLRKQAMEILGLNITSADAEVALSEQRLSDRQWGYTLPANSESLAMGTETTVQALTDSRVSTIFAIRNTDSIIRQDAIFSPNGAMNNCWAVMSPSTTAKKLATLKLPTNNRGGLVRIGTDNIVYYRYFNGSSWGSWTSVFGMTAVDVTAVAYANGQADIFIAGTDGVIRQSHSTNGQSWGTWITHPCCASEVAAGVLPNGVLYLAAQATTAQFAYSVWVTTYNGVWTPWTNLGQPPGGPTKDLAMLPNPDNTLYLATVGADQCTIYPRYWNGSSWENWFAYTSCYKNVSAFRTSDGGGYILYLGKSNSSLYTERFNGSISTGITPQGGTWIATAGFNVDDETGNAYEHTEANDDCRVVTGTTTSGYVCDNSGNCFYTQGVNLAEIIYNEARGETPGAQDTVGWVVRNRAFQGLSCDSYPGAQGGFQG
ncbi:MAG: hypothetical protein AB7P69_21600 [Candidatus Binatia bacterium]